MLSYPNQITSIKNFTKQIPNNELKLEETKPNSFISTDSMTEPNTNSNPKKQKYIFENNNKSYSITLILFEEKIKILVYPLTKGKEEYYYYYEKDFTQEELKNNNKVFKLCNDIEESYEYFNDLFKDSENHLIVNESNDFFKIEKKMQLSLPLKIEITKKYINNINNFSQNNNNIDVNIKNNIIQNNDTKNISPLIYKNNEIKKKIDILEQANDNIMELVKKKYLQNEERINNLSQNIVIVDNMVDYMNEKKKEENKKQIGNLLNKKRTSISDISDISFNSNSNDNEFNNKKNKNILAKETFLKIFSDNNSDHSGDSNEKFFMKILKKKKLEEENNHVEKNNINNNEKKVNAINKIDEEENESYLYGEQDSSDEIKDDIDFFSNKSPSITAIGPKNNNINNESFNLYNNEKNKNQINLFKNDNKFINVPNTFYKNNNNNPNDSIPNYYKNNSNIQMSDENKIKNNKNYYEKIKNEKSYILDEEDSYDMNDNYFGKDFYYKKNKGNKIYKIIHKNFVESFNMDKSFEFQNKNQSKNNIFSVDSKIITNYDEFDFIINYLKNKFDKEIINSIRIYRATEDGDKADDFHRLCDGNTNIIVLIKTKDGKKIGGYTSIGFNNYNQSNLDDTAFLFSIDKREIYPNIKGKNAIESYYNLGPTFSGDTIKIYDNFLIKGGITSKNGINFETNEDFQINDGKKSFAVEEIEVLEFLELKIDNNI